MHTSSLVHKRVFEDGCGNELLEDWTQDPVIKNVAVPTINYYQVHATVILQ